MSSPREPVDHADLDGAEIDGADIDGADIDRPNPPGDEQAEKSGPASRAVTEDLPSSPSIERAIETQAPPGTDVAPADAESATPGGSTLAAPSYRAPVSRARGSDGRPELDLRPGETIEDFEVVELIGKGAFGGVYLARQLTLDRLVALKITGNRGSEGRTLAQLEHDYIVRVFSETVDQSGRFRLLCMQLVPGASLEDVIHRLRRVARIAGLRGGAATWSGADYLAAIDSKPGKRDDDASRVHDVFDTTALRDREQIGRFDDVQTVAWVGARLAEAVDYAHKRSVLHRDIKPANVLVNRYGRPLLADFNIAQRTFADGVTDGAFGGTIAFMAPEHLDAFNPKRDARVDDVDERSDLYSLGIVIHELMTGRSPFDDPDQEAGRATFVGRLADARRAAKPPIGDGPTGARKVLQRTIAKTLEPEKENRYPSGAELAAALDGASAHRAAEREFPKRGLLTRAMQRAALVWLMVLVAIPQFISSAVNIAYNMSEIGKKLDDDQWSLFWNGLVPGYNVVVYPLLLGLGLLVTLPVFRVWSEVRGTERVDPERVQEARRRALRLPLWLLMLVAAGWLPGGLLFPLLIDWLQGPIGWNIYAHFVTSFTLSGLIAAA
ncbi:MAG: serine/threonine-protein kinase, partial [Planctomycetota bacterium]